MGKFAPSIVLNLSGCPVGDLSLEISEETKILFINGCDLSGSSIKSDNLSLYSALNCNLGSFDFNAMRNLVSLDLSGNRLSSIDFDQPNIPLKQFIVRNNEISGEIRIRSHTLSRLDVSQNKLDSLCISGYCPSLAFLDASHNKITFIKELVGTANIETLRINDNQIQGK